MRERWQPFPRLFVLRLLGLLLLGASAAAQEAPPPPPPQDVTLEQYGPPDPPALERGCQDGKVENCIYLAILYERGEPGDRVEADPDKAHTLWVRIVELSQKSCDAGSIAGCAELGRAYSLGRGLDKDPAHAASLFSRACDGDDAMSCFLLGRTYTSGRGVDKDPARAAALLAKACARGFKPACGTRE
jgi:uncharacterized protein